MSGDDSKKLPPEEQKTRRKLGEAMLRFVKKNTEMMMIDLERKSDTAGEEGKAGAEPEKDDARRRQLTQNYRIEVERAAKKGIESALTWHTLAVWTEEGKERIGYFARALECVECEVKEGAVPKSAGPGWSDTHMQADCLFEIGRVHAGEGDAAVARDFLLRALPLAQEAERLRGAAGITHEDNLEGRIAELLLKLPEDGGTE